jgi:choline dehydrogenase
LRVLLIEAGPVDRSPFIRLPKGVGKLMGDPTHLFHYPVTSGNGPPDRKPETLVRGKVLGGSSAVNGMVYLRGQPQDYDAWEALGLKGWGWKDMQPCFVALEDHVMPQTSWRGRGGPVGITLNKPTKLGRAVIRAAGDLGLPPKEDPTSLTNWASARWPRPSIGAVGGSAPRAAS